MQIYKVPIVSALSKERIVLTNPQYRQDKAYVRYVCEVEYVHSPKMIRRREELKRLFLDNGKKGKTFFLCSNALRTKRRNGRFYSQNDIMFYSRATAIFFTLYLNFNFWLRPPHLTY